MLVEKIPGIRTRTDFAKLLNGAAELAVIFTYAFVIFIYVVVAKISLTLASIHPSATPIWPTAGFALACVLLLGYRIVPAIFVGSFIVNITTAGSLYTSVGIAAGNTIEGLVTAFVLNEWARSRNAFERPWDVGKVIASCFAPGAMISATIGVICLSLGGYAESANFRTLWTTWWIGKLVGHACYCAGSGAVGKGMAAVFRARRDGAVPLSLRCDFTHRFARLQPVARTNSEPDGDGVSGGLATDMGRRSTQSARHRDDRPVALGLRGVGHDDERRTLRAQ